MLTKTREMCALLCLQIAEVWYKCFQKMAHPDRPSVCFIRKSSHSIYECRTMTMGVARTVMSQSATTDWIKLLGHSFSSKAGREFIVVAAFGIPNKKNAFNKSLATHLKVFFNGTKLSYTTAPSHATDDSHMSFEDNTRRMRKQPDVKPQSWTASELCSFTHSSHSCGNQGTELSWVWLAQACL